MTHWLSDSQGVAEGDEDVGKNTSGFIMHTGGHAAELGIERDEDEEHDDPAIPLRDEQLHAVERLERLDTGHLQV